MINLPAIIGNIRPVALSSYKEIIDNYVEKAGKFEQVSSIIQIGSFSSPGISDIDLIVIIKDSMPFPSWDEISLKEISKNHKDSEVVAHDIFVIPESIGQKAEAYFYIDQQNVLKGKPLGGQIQKELVEKCKEFLAIEYALFSLDSIASLLLSAKVDVRNMTLLISTMRHSAVLALNLKIIDEAGKEMLVNRVEKLRSDILSLKYNEKDFSCLFEKFINLLNRTTRVILKNLNKEIVGGHLKKSWMASSKAGMVGVSDKVDYLTSFLKLIEKQKDTFASKYTKLFTVPIESQMHIGAYLDGNEKAAVYFRKNFKTVRPFHDNNFLNTQVRKLRGEIVRKHWEFINKTGYFKSSGKAYCGLSYPEQKSYKSLLRKSLLYYQLQK